MCSWTFSPYAAEFWQCTVEEVHEGHCLATLEWKNNLPKVLTHTELARDLVMMPCLPGGLYISCICSLQGTSVVSCLIVLSNIGGSSSMASLLNLIEFVCFLNTCI